MTEYNPAADEPVAIVPVEEPAAIEVAPQLEELPPAPEPTPEPMPVPVEEPVAVVAVEPEPVVAVPQEEPKPKAKEPKVAVSGGDKDAVILANCVYKNVYARKSLTVHHVQRRLNELGYPEANADKDGWYGDLTKLSVSNFQKANGLAATGIMDADTITKLFEGDNNVEVVL